MIQEHVDTYNLIFLCKKRSSNAVHGRISPTLDQSLKKKTRRRGETNLIIEATFLVQEIEKFHICLAAPEIQVTNLKVAPD